MRREPGFVLSHRPYAVNLESFRPLDAMNRDGGEWTWHGIDAAWFRRRQGVTVACTGLVKTLLRPAPVDVAEFLGRHTDGRYGGECLGRWDGARYWGSQLPDVAAQHLQLLRPMLDAYPAPPDGFDGWWAF